MRRMRWGWVVLGIIAGSGVFGCGSDKGCADLCARQTECAQDSGVIAPTEQECVDECEALSADDPDYAAAVSDRASCLQDTSCEEISFGFACVPDG